MTDQQDVPDHLRSGLDLVIVGINPGNRSGAMGHHYAWPGNHFWPVLYESGIIPEKITFADDHRVLDWGIGLTNLVDRTTRGVEDLTAAEMRQGAVRLKEKLLRYRPRAVCFNGKSIYEAFSGRRKVKFGLQAETLEGMLLFVVPSSSARTAAYQRPAKVEYFRELKRLLDETAAEREQAATGQRGVDPPTPNPGGIRERHHPSGGQRARSPSGLSPSPSELALSGAEGERGPGGAV